MAARLVPVGSYTARVAQGAVGVSDAASTRLRQAAVTGSQRRRGLQHRLGIVALVTAALGALGLILLTHGVLPGYLPNESVGYLTEGAIRCEHQLGFHALLHRCHSYGNPGGYGLLTNGPLILLGAFIMVIPGVTAGTAYALASGIIDLVALAGGYGLARWLGAGRGLALWAGCLYLISPTVLGMLGFPGTFGGYELLPFYALADVLLLRQVERGGRALGVAVAAYALIRTGALFMDGYSFVASALVTACIWLAWAWRTGRGRRVWIAAALMLLGNVVAYGLYDAYIPGVYPANPPGIFRSMGLDLITLIRPTQYEWFAHLGGFAWDPSHLWGDGTNSGFNYLGFGCLVLTGLAFVLGRRWPGQAGRPGSREDQIDSRRLALALALAGAVALVLSLGPALKVDSQKRVANNGGPVTYQSYLMPQSQAVAEFPWDRLYWHLPGVKSMRAAYRWFGITRMALIMLAAVGLQRLLRRRRWWAVAVVLGAIATFELLPNYPLLLDGYRAARTQLRSAANAVGGELRTLTKPGQRVFFLNYQGEHNDFMVNYFAPAAGIEAYNAGGDKDAYFAMKGWPPDVLAMASPTVGPQAVYRALRWRVVNVVLVPFFDLRWSAYSWPPTPQFRLGAERSFESILTDRRFRVRELHWLAAVTLRP
jgi:hypothetical protein